MSVKGSLRVGSPDEVISSPADVREPHLYHVYHGTCGCMAGNSALHGEQDDPRVYLHSWARARIFEGMSLMIYTVWRNASLLILCAASGSSKNGWRLHVEALNPGGACFHRRRRCLLLALLLEIVP